MSHSRHRTICRSAQVKDDIIAIYVYVHRRSPQSAEKVFDAIERSIRRLVDLPGVGRYWNSPDPRLAGMRVTTVRPYRNYLIFFRLVEKTIEVFRVVHAARDLAPLVDEIVFDEDDGGQDQNEGASV